MTERSEQTGGEAAHELAVARALVAALRAAGEDVDDPRPRGSPDAVVSSPRGPIGIEVAEAFYEEATASAARPWSTPAKGLEEGNPGAALAAQLNETLRDQCRRAFGMPTYFVIDVRPAPPEGAAEGQALAAAITIPDGCRFARIFLRLSPPAGGDPVVVEVSSHRTVPAR